MGVAPHPGVARGGASFELDRLEHDDGRLVVRGWWLGVRGVRFVRPALVVDGRQVLATLDHKPWIAAEDGSWIAAFPWTRDLDVAGVTLVVAPSVAVPLDRDAEPPALELVPAAPVTVVEEVRDPLRDELADIERRLDAAHAELREARDHAAERDARCRELEGVVARERRAAGAARDADDEFVRAHALAVLDRERALEQHAEAVADREAAVRARKRMERQRDEALAQRAEAQARRDEALAERDDVRRRYDELLLAHAAVDARLKRALAEGARTRQLASVEPAARPPAEPSPRAGDPDEEPLGVRTIPAARTVAASLHRSQRERERVVTRYDLWAIRILGSVAALAFILLLAVILRAFFPF